MMAREMNVYHSAIAATGKKKQTDEYALTVRYEWPKNNGEKKSKETAGLAFPAVLDDMPEERRLAYITEILLAEARIAAGVDD